MLLHNINDCDNTPSVLQTKVREELAHLNIILQQHKNNIYDSVSEEKTVATRLASHCHPWTVSSYD